MSATARARILLFAGMGLALAGCGGGPQYVSGSTHYSAGRVHYTVAPYQINGVWYYPKVDYGYDASGTASWYGPGFDHRATADGEIYDMNDLTAAHKTLPLPSVVEVTNLQNGRELQLRVNDRGPFVGDRLIDVSRRAAQLLGFEGHGTTQVRVRVLRDESIQVAEAAMRGQAGTTAVAAAPAPVRVAAAARPPLRPIEVTPTPAPMPPPIEVAAAAPPAAREEFVAATPPAAEEEPPPRRVAPPPAEPAPRRMAEAPRRRYWPSLIASAEAAPLRTPIMAPTVATRGPGRIFIQAGAFAVPENAQRVRTRIAILGAAEVVSARVNGSALYRVRLGPVANTVEAHRLLSRVIDSGYPGARLVEQ